MHERERRYRESDKNEYETWIVSMSERGRDNVRQGETGRKIRGE